MGRRGGRWGGVESDGEDEIAVQRDRELWRGLETDGERWRAMGRGIGRWGGVESDGEA